MPGSGSVTSTSGPRGDDQVTILLRCPRLSSYIWSHVTPDDGLTTDNEPLMQVCQAVRHGVRRLRLYPGLPLALRSHLRPHTDQGPRAQDPEVDHLMISLVHITNNLDLSCDCLLLLVIFTFLFATNR